MKFVSKLQALPLNKLTVPDPYTPHLLDAGPGDILHLSSDAHLMAGTAEFTETGPTHMEVHVHLSKSGVITKKALDQVKMAVKAVIPTVTIKVVK